jgi:hypothetical protein
LTLASIALDVAGATCGVGGVELAPTIDVTTSELRTILANNSARLRGDMYGSVGQ